VEAARRLLEDALRRRGFQQDHAQVVVIPVEVLDDRPHDEVAAVPVPVDDHDARDALVPQRADDVLDHRRERVVGEPHRARGAAVHVTDRDGDRRQAPDGQPPGNLIGEVVHLKGIGAAGEVRAVLLRGAERQQRHLGASGRKLGARPPMVQDLRIRLHPHLYSGRHSYETSGAGLLLN
jgi:hypothetical protein